MIEKLEPCPFCGGEAELTGFAAPEFWVHCQAIGCKANTEAFGSKERAIAAWNRRPTPTQDTRDRVKVLEEALGLALHYLVQSEPGDSRAVSDEFVAMAAIHAGLGGEKAMTVIRKATALGNKETDRHG